MSVWRISWLAVFFSVLIWSGVKPKDFTTWVLEVMPALIAIAVLFYTRNSFPLTTLGRSVWATEIEVELRAINALHIHFGSCHEACIEQPSRHKLSSS